MAITAISSGPRRANGVALKASWAGIDPSSPAEIIGTNPSIVSPGQVDCAFCNSQTHAVSKWVYCKGCQAAKPPLRNISRAALAPSPNSHRRGIGRPVSNRKKAFTRQSVAHSLLSATSSPKLLPSRLPARLYFFRNLSAFPPCLRSIRGIPWGMGRISSAFNRGLPLFLLLLRTTCLSARPHHPITRHPTSRHPISRSNHAAVR